jgi:nucleoside triphosphate pyrophosphatase
VRLVLASASPRRAELLSAADFAFDIVPANTDETVLSGEPPRDYALRVARAKAEHVAASVSGDSVVLGADTVVVSAGRLMGKPVDAADAESMLRGLSGLTHEVHTAVVVLGSGSRLEELVTTSVRFISLTDAEVAWYLSTGEWAGKAGAYGIQGRAARFIDRIDGSWSNVVGLPIATVYQLLTAAGLAGERGAAKHD